MPLAPSTRGLALQRREPAAEAAWTIGMVALCVQGQSVAEVDTTPGWVRLAHSMSGDAGRVDLSSSASLIQDGGGLVRMAWSTSGTPADANLMSSYEKIVEFQVPGAVTAGSRPTAGQKCTNSDYFTLVDVTCVQGACNMPAQMYTGTGFNRICYDNAYGLVNLNGQGHDICDWHMDSQNINSLYLGSFSGKVCNGVKDTTGAVTTGSAMNAVSIWYLGSSPSATGDPHLQNVFGERFDLMKPGNHVLINIPRGESVENALLLVTASAKRLGAECADVYFRELNITGSWAEATQVGGYRRPHRQTLWRPLSGLPLARSR
ncbi:unnamed protein product [Prorocentrum cordatum]|uniref:Uncharacterized protein n=1 Tax=Prorocentrum cordatum TaxID=2364126 RepID=A0ABN9XHW1_9DINO|nr:unnamed protein product [Polarella glacialis]